MAKSKRSYHWLIIDCPDDPKAVCAEAYEGVFADAAGRAKAAATNQKITTVLMGNFGGGWQAFGQWTGRKPKAEGPAKST
jgi:hypothetical protein